MVFFFFFNDTATTEIYTLSLHDALPISRRLRAGNPELYPGRLDVRDPGVKCEPADGVHEHGLAEARAPAGPALQVDRGLHVNERERHELREAARAAFLLPQAQQVAGPVARPVDVPEHDRGRRA